jgi:pathogenesis-related protein 1
MPASSPGRRSGAVGAPWAWTRLILPLALVACTGAGDGLSKRQADEMLRAHNSWRDRVGATPLHWSQDLTSRAQAHATSLASHGCRLSHGPLPDDVGENLYLAGPRLVDDHPNELVAIEPSDVVDAWSADADAYSPADGTCAPGRQCGHYTQIIWASTRDVGCGVSVCPTLGQIWVCQYRPAGNVRLAR